MSSPVVTWQSNIPGSRGFWFSLFAFLLSQLTQKTILLSPKVFVDPPSPLNDTPSSLSQGNSNPSFCNLASAFSHHLRPQTELFAPSSRTPNTSSC